MSQKDLEKGLPGFNHTYVKLKDGVFCGGGLILLDPGICNEYRLNLMNKMIQVRKNPLEMAKILGAKTLFKIVSGQATREDLEKRTSEVFKCKAISIITPYIEIGINIDKPEELDLIRSSG
ncbi:MAG: hypothetical protein BWY64_03920 [bacterium ADurb.Bin363]|nr:MAG: hypothetical protein BWY64_03920 [bacterium ADurb.Bin363]